MGEPLNECHWLLRQECYGIELILYARLDIPSSTVFRHEKHASRAIIRA
jgi:hypothetical protein